MSPDATLMEVSIFLNDAERYQKKYPKERSRLVFSLIKQTKRLAKKYTDMATDLDLEIGTIRVRHASTDEKGNLIENKFDVKQGKGEDGSVLRFAYKPEAQNKMAKEVKEFTKKYNEEKKIEILPPYANEPFYLEIPEGFDFNFLESFKKFIFNPESDEVVEEQCYLNNSQEQKPTIQSILN